MADNKAGTGLKELRGIAPYPQCFKLSAASDSMQVIRDFLDWVEETKRYEIAAWRPTGQSMQPILESLDSLLQQYFEIDPVALENERRAMLAEESKRHG